MSEARERDSPIRSRACIPAHYKCNSLSCVTNARKSLLISSGMYLLL